MRTKPAATAVATVLAGSALAATLVAAPLGHAAERSESPQVARGRYLVTVGGCNDCHTPWKLGERGPEPEAARLLSGHPEGLAMPPAPKLAPGPWVASVAGSMTAWAGPWGVTFTANLTPDRETGLGAWTEDDFVTTLRSGRHLGRGRPILPPMPWANYAQMTDEDLKAMFAYLRSIPAVKNRVPQPIVPEQHAGAAAR